ncbi:MAG: hypothetical protein CVU43_23565 [Chloroflexi bacterium HGW-Chloroflexi-5]|jgi:uncharacterized membrane protein|nr:MAG: hypothetical protein CVU43_23565 [Chloroflexi bacterium HGW-Chloroflexi-5]
MKRIDSIDVLRALAIIFMVLCHFPVNLSPVDGQYPWVYFFSNHIIGDFAAAIFLVLVGVSQVLSSSKTGYVPISAQFWKDRAIRRGVLIFVIGLIFSMLMRGWEAIFEWDILTLIGASLIVIRLLGRLPAFGFLLVGLIFISPSPFLREYSQYLQHWGNSMTTVPGINEILPGILYDPSGEYAPTWSIQEIVEGFFVEGYFPIFPWLFFPLFGVFLGKASFMQSQEKSPDTRLHIVFMIAGGFALSIIGTVISFAARTKPPLSVVNEYISPFSFYPSTLSMQLLQLGMVLILFGILRACYDRGARESVWLTYCRRLSRYSLTVYVLHHAVMLWPMWLIGGIAEGPWDQFYAQAINEPLALSLSILVMILLGPALGVWDRVQGKFSLEWWLTKLAGAGSAR